MVRQLGDLWCYPATLGRNTIATIPDEWNHSNSIPFGDVRRMLVGATLPLRNSVLAFVKLHANRIRPAMDDDWLYDTMSSYFLDCIIRPTHSNANDDSIHSPFESAHELVEWFNWIVVRDDDSKTMRQRTDRIANVYKDGNSSAQNCIETGFLEHVLEIPQNRPFFSHWERDKILAECYTHALKWGEAHTQPTAG